MAVYDITNKAITRFGSDGYNSFGVIYIRLKDLPAPAVGDVWRLSMVPVGCLPVAWGIHKFSPLGDNVEAEIRFTDKPGFVSKANMGGVGSTGLGSLNVPAETKSTRRRRAPGGEVVPVEQEVGSDTWDYLEVEFTSVANPMEGGAFDLYIFYLNI